MVSAEPSESRGELSFSDSKEPYSQDSASSYLSSDLYSEELSSEKNFSEEFDLLSEIEYEGPDRFDTSWHLPLNPSNESPFTEAPLSEPHTGEEWSEEWTEELSTNAPSLFQLLLNTLVNPTQDKFYSFVIYGIILIFILGIILFAI